MPLLVQLRPAASLAHRAAAAAAAAGALAAPRTARGLASASAVSACLRVDSRPVERARRAGSCPIPPHSIPLQGGGRPFRVLGIQQVAIGALNKQVGDALLEAQAPMTLC